MKTLLIALAVTAILHGSAFAADYVVFLKPESLYTKTEEGLERIIQLIVEEKNQAAADQMFRDGEALVSPKKPTRVFLVNIGLEAGVEGYMEFHFKGETVTYWTVDKVLDFR
jgi:hypothetical protein